MQQSELVSRALAQEVERRAAGVVVPRAIETDAGALLPAALAVTAIVRFPR
jgi:hypothetical protein